MSVIKPSAIEVKVDSSKLSLTAYKDLLSVTVELDVAPCSSFMV